MDQLLNRAINKGRETDPDTLSKFYEERIAMSVPNTPRDFAIKCILKTLFTQPIDQRIRRAMLDLVKSLSVTMQFENADAQPRYLIINLLRFTPGFLMINAPETFTALIRALEALHPYLRDCAPADQALCARVLDILRGVPPDATYAARRAAIDRAARL